jgi:hypothetical protein
MKKLYLCTLLLAFAGALGAQSSWSWGVSLQFGQSGTALNESSEYHHPSLISGQVESRTVFTPSTTVGCWLAYRLSHRWSLQTGLQYRYLSIIRQREEHTYDPTDQLIRFQSSRSELHQQTLEAPLRLRFYWASPQRSFRPFFSIQAAPAYLLSGGELKIAQYADIVRADKQVLAYSDRLDFGKDYVRSSPLQLTYGAELGLQWQSFALSLTHNRTIRAERLDYDPNLHLICISSPIDYYHYTQTRILRNTNLQLQYQF